MNSSALTNGSSAFQVTFPRRRAVSMATVISGQECGGASHGWLVLCHSAGRSSRVDSSPALRTASRPAFPGLGTWRNSSPVTSLRSQLSSVVVLTEYSPPSSECKPDHPSSLAR